MSQPIRPLILAVLCALAASAAQAGRVDVSFDAHTSFTDAGSTPHQREERLGALAEHLKALGARWLSDDRRLNVELIDLDLAGTMELLRHPAGTELRVVRGGADGPHIELRYTLSDANSVLSSGHETLFEAGLAGPDLARDSAGGDPLRLEKRLLDHWFVERFGSTNVPGR